MSRRVRYQVWAHMEGDVKEVMVTILARDNMDAREQFREMMDKLKLSYAHAYAERQADLR